MKRLAGLAAVVVLVGSACSDATGPADRRDNPLIGKSSAEAKAALARQMGLDPTPRSYTGDNRVYAQFPPLFFNPNLGTNLLQGDDDCDFVAFNFPFTFFGQVFTGVWVNSNGNITFGNCFTTFTPTTLPAGANRIIAPLFFDIDPGAGGGVFFNVVGTPGNRKFIVTWAGVPAFALGGSNTYQLQLLERLNVILFMYNRIQTNGFNWTGTPLTAGIASGVAGGFGGFPGLFVIATGAQVPALDGNTFCLINLGGQYRVFNNLVCSLFVL